MVRRVLGVLALLVLSGCGAPSATITPLAAGPQASVCPATAEFGPSGGFPERQGVGKGATLYALFFPTGPAIVAGTEIKVVWRMTGTGAFTIAATGPDTTKVTPVWGPEPHGGSTFERPGDEWGTGWSFPEPGCWTITATRADSSAYLIVRVAP
jgi:hypothetical protein